MARFIIALSFFIFDNNRSFSQTDSSFHLSFNHLAISVSDLDQSARFYKTVLQLTEISNRTKMDGIRWFSIDGINELHLISILKEKVVTNKAVHFALSSNHFDEVLNNLQKNNIVYSDWPGNLNKINMRADGIKQVFFQDPDGYWIELNSVKKP